MLGGEWRGHVHPSDGTHAAIPTCMFPCFRDAVDGFDVMSGCDGVVLCIYLSPK